LVATSLLVIKTLEAHFMVASLVGTIIDTTHRTPQQTVLQQAFCGVLNVRRRIIVGQQYLLEKIG
jgi:hypothetical protein